MEILCWLGKKHRCTWPVPTSSGVCEWVRVSSQEENTQLFTYWWLMLSGQLIYSYPPHQTKYLSLSGGTSPPGVYTQNMPPRSAASGLPPILPPLLQQTVLNQDQPYVCVHFSTLAKYVCSPATIKTPFPLGMFYLLRQYYFLLTGGSYTITTTKSCHFEPSLCPVDQGT